MVGRVVARGGVDIGDLDRLTGEERVGRFESEGGRVVRGDGARADEAAVGRVGPDEERPHRGQVPGIGVEGLVEDQEDRRLLVVDADPGMGRRAVVQQPRRPGVGLRLRRGGERRGDPEPQGGSRGAGFPARAAAAFARRSDPGHRSLPFACPPASVAGTSIHPVHGNRFRFAAVFMPSGRGAAKENGGIAPICRRPPVAPPGPVAARLSGAA